MARKRKRIYWNEKRRRRLRPGILTRYPPILTIEGDTDEDCIIVFSKAATIIALELTDDKAYVNMHFDEKGITLTFEAEPKEFVNDKLLPDVDKKRFYINCRYRKYLRQWLRTSYPEKYYFFMFNIGNGVFKLIPTPDPQHRLWLSKKT